MDRLIKFKKLALVKRVLDECEKSLQVNEMAVAEFMIDLAKNSKDIEEFRAKLIENGAEFDDDTIRLIYNKTIKIHVPAVKMENKNFTNGALMTVETEKMEKSGLDKH